MSEQPPQYTAAHIQQQLAEDDRTAEQGIRVHIRDRHVFLRGDVPSVQRRERVAEVVRELLPDHEIHNEVGVTDSRAPAGEERL